MNKNVGNLNNYKPIKKLNNGKYVISWGLKKLSNDLYQWNFYIFDSKPSLEEIKKVINDSINKVVKNIIENKLIWNNMNVLLPIEKQLDYKLLLDTTLLLDGTNLPETIKLNHNGENVYYKFEDIDDLKDFIISINNHIRKSLQFGYNLKDSINYDEYTI